MWGCVRGLRRLCMHLLCRCSLSSKAPGSGQDDRACIAMCVHPLSAPQLVPRSFVNFRVALSGQPLSSQVQCAPSQCHRRGVQQTDEAQRARSLVRTNSRPQGGELPGCMAQLLWQCMCGVAAWASLHVGQARAGLHACAHFTQLPRKHACVRTTLPAASRCLDVCAHWPACPPPAAASACPAAVQSQAASSRPRCAGYPSSSSSACTWRR